MRGKTLVIVLALAVLALSIWPARQLGTEFMPNLNEGTLLYMPTTLPRRAGDGGDKRSCRQWSLGRKRFRLMRRRLRSSKRRARMKPFTDIQMPGSMDGLKLAAATVVSNLPSRIAFRGAPDGYFQEAEQSPRDVAG